MVFLIQTDLPGWQMASAMSHAIHKIVSKRRCQSYFISRRSPHHGISKDSDLCASAHRCPHYAYARLIARVNSQFTSLMEREGIAVLHDADHSLAGIEDDLITIVVVVSRGAVIGGLLPIHVNPPAVRKEPAVSRGVVALECQVSLAQLFIKGILHQNILESQLLAGQCIDMRSVRTAGQMLGTIIETVILIEFKITPGQRVTP